MMFCVSCSTELHFVSLLITKLRLFMKVLHTADWHLGHRLHEQSQQEEQQLFLDWLTDLILKEAYDVLLISGDVFDTAMPSSQSLGMYYNFLVGLNKTCCQYIIITGGNHDAPGTLNAPKELLNALSIYVVGKATENIADEVFKITVGNETLFVGAVPYLRDQDVRKAVAGESFEDVNQRYKAALIHHYNCISTCIEEQNTTNAVVIAMGHLFAIGGSVSDSEKDISVGNLGHIGAEDFPDAFNYVALGHLHKPQKVGGKETIRYSGSPVALSFSEIQYSKKVMGLTIDHKQIQDIEEITIPSFRTIVSIAGTLEACVKKLKMLAVEEDTLETWVEVVLDNESPALEIAEIKKVAEDLKIHVLKITLKNKQETVGLETLLENVKQIKKLKPAAIFKQKCEEQGIDFEEHKELLDAFNEALMITQEQEV